MERHFEHDLQELTAAVQRMGGLVEQAISRSVEALNGRDDRVAAEVIRADEEIDRLELEIDERAMTLLARYQLAAGDLRFVTTVLKITPSLERIGDYAANIGERAIELGKEPPSRRLVDIPLMARRAQEMLRGALDAFGSRDTASARAVIAMDDELDQRLEQIFRVLLSHMIEDPRTITRALRLTFVAKLFERIGDQATNICEMIVYMTEGQVIRHRGPAEQAPTP
ncbi:MAG: phosphate signaling complex protein PhoU [Acidobacteria bacterium]|nr:phosphate signaling complex protein PhoU [Acidobacteriota bacterium]